LGVLFVCFYFNFGLEVKEKMKCCEGIGSYLKRTTLANVAAFLLVLSGFGVAAWLRDEKTLAFVVGAAVTYLLKRTEKQE